jgi:hypothetical protein
MRNAPAVNAATGVMTTDDDGLGRYIYYATAATFYRYDTWSDSWIQLATIPVTPATFGNMTYTKNGGTRGRVISSPSATTLQIPGFFGNQLVGKTIRIITGTGAGQVKTITACTEPTVADSGFITSTQATTPAFIADSTKKWKYNQWSGYQCRLTFGTGATQIRKILYNDTTTLYFMDTNYQPIDPWNNTAWATVPISTAATPTNYVIESSVITTSAWTTRPDYTSIFLINSGAVWYLSAVGSGAWFNFLWYDVLMDAWYVRTTPTGLVLAAFGTDSSIEKLSDVGGTYTSGTSSGAGSDFVINTAETLVVDRWRNYQVRITGGTGIGQHRRIVCNTANRIEVDAKFEVLPAADTTWSIVANSGVLHWMGGAKSAMFAHDLESDLFVQASTYDDGISCDFAATMSGWKPIGVTSMTTGANGINTITAIPPTKGTGYKVGDILTVSDGTGGKVMVETISGAGVVETLSLVAAGSGYTVATHATTGGSGNAACTVAVATRSTVGRIVTPISHFFKIGDTVTLSGADAATTGWNGATTIIGVDSLTGFDVINATANAVKLATNSATLIVDCTKNWTINEHTGKIVQSHLVGVTGTMVARRITSNTATSLTVATITTAMVNGTGRYIITDVSPFGRDVQYKNPTFGNEGHASGGGDTTLTDSSKTWFGNQWNGYKVRIIAGVGRGKELAITGNTATTLTYASSGVTPDATTHYVIMDTFGQPTTASATVITDTTKNWGFTGTTNMFDGKSVRIIAGTGLGQEALVTAGTATTLTYASSPTVVANDSVYAILGAPVRGAGIKLLWQYGGTNTDTKGKYIWCPRGGTTTQLDRYDITTEKFEYGIMMSPQFETYAAGTMWVYDGEDKILVQKDALGRVYCYNTYTGMVSGIGQPPYGHGAALIGNRMELIETADGLQYLYMMRHSDAVMWRCLLIPGL